MKLFYREHLPSEPLAGAPALVVLHGLLGSSRNWTGSGGALARHGPVYTLDLRNHGQSPHDPEMTLAAMAGDVFEFLDDHGLGGAVLMGHSLGGKVAMRLACKAQARVRRLFVLDVAPRAHPADPTILDALLELDLKRGTSRADLDARLSERIPDQGMRLFLLTNLVRVQRSESFEWQVPLPVLRANLDELYRAPVEEGDLYEGPVRFVVGGDSDFFGPADLERARHFFPRAELEVLGGVGHNVHTEGGERFLEAVGDWAAG